MTDDFVGLRFPHRASLLLAISASVSGCATLAPESAAPDIAANVPPQFSQPAMEQPYRPARWWAAFEDPVLNGVLDEVLAGNLDLVEASARLRAAEAQARISGAGLLPQVSAGLSGNYSDSPTAGTNFGAFTGGGRLQNETYSSSLSIAYEVDIWGRLRGEARARQTDAIAAAADLQAVRLTVLSNAITTYFNMVDARHQIDLTTKIIDVLSDRLEQTENRYRRGLVTSFELYQVRQDFRNAQSGLPSRKSQLAASEGQLAVLVGRYSNDMDALIGLEMTPRLVFESVPAGLPIELLARRPDVFAESQRLESARQTVGVAKAAQFPALSLSAGSGTQAGGPEGVFNIFDNWILNLGAGLTAPLFQGGRIKANIDVADARYTQQAAVYARTVLTAFQEVETANRQYDEERQRYRFLFAQLEEATASVNLQSRQFARGVGSYVNYLDALRAQYQVQSALSSAARDVALARLDVHRALGGSWTDTPAQEGDDR